MFGGYRRGYCFLALLLKFWAAPYTQQVFGSIFGTVTDPSGSAVVAAKVTVTDISKGTQSEVSTDVSGNYTKGQLVPDQYTVTIEARGFRPVKSDAFDVRVDAAVRYDGSLKVGDVANEVEVVAAAPMLQSDRSDVAQTFTSKEINDLPNRSEEHTSELQSLRHLVCRP